jgi:membrane-bound metal-dependent hydrolase YbcI (DUF457 family)
MPTPVGHALGGLATAWAADLVPGDRRWRTAAAPWLVRAGGATTVACALLGALPDIDLLFGGHRTYSHSLTAVAIVAVAAAIVSAWRRLPGLRFTLMCAAAYGSHLLFDWLSVDDHVPRGVELLWPFSHAWFISPWSLFPPTERHPLFAWSTWLIDARAVGVELAVFVPIVVVAWLIRVKALARLPPVLPGGDHAAE